MSGYISVPRSLRHALSPLSANECGQRASVVVTDKSHSRPVASRSLGSVEQPFATTFLGQFLYGWREAQGTDRAFFASALVLT